MNLRRVWYYAKFVLLALVLLIAVLAAGRSWLVRDRVGLQLVFSNPSDELITTAEEIPDGSGRFLALEKKGRLLWFQPGDGKASGPAGDLTDRVKITNWEDGLLNVVFHPRYRDNGYVFFYYTAAPPLRTVVARYTMDVPNAKLKPGSERILFTLPKDKPDHNGGGMVFGPDGYLYVGVGDGNRSFNAPDRKSLSGAVLRVDVDKAAGDKAYAVPADNPWADGKDGALPELFAKGFRNPWRLSFDSTSGLMLAADVGDHHHEEIDVVRKGADYGWDRLEGDRCRLKEGCAGLDVTPPLAVFSRDLLRAIIGGHIYRGETIPALQGRYVFGDYFRGLYAIDPTKEPPIRWPSVVSYRPLSQLPKTKGAFILIASITQDQKGELYLVELTGGVYRLIPHAWWQGWTH